MSPRTALAVGWPPAPARAVAAAIARAALPPERGVPAPAWLRPRQATLVRRALAALDAHGGVLIAEPTGTGKTWIALAAASLAARGPHHCLVPAALAGQWRATYGMLDGRFDNRMLLDYVAPAIE